MFYSSDALSHLWALFVQSSVCLNGNYTFFATGFQYSTLKTKNVHYYYQFYNVQLENHILIFVTYQINLVKKKY